MVKLSVRVIITGHVQGVWFRGWTVASAKELDLWGWVRNRKVGSVEAVFHGEQNAIEKMIERCYHGPAAASVERVDVIYESINIKPGFEQIATL